MTHTSTMRTRLLAGAVLTAGLVLSGCGGSADPSAPTAVDQRTCDQIRQVPAPTNAATTAVVIDPTASSTSGGFTPAAVAVLNQARDEGGVVDVVAVDGAGARPRTVVRGLPLDPAPGVDSVQADRARAAVVPCIEEWMRSPDAAPTAPGSDVVAAVDEAARHRPARLLVVSDGVATAGRLDLNLVGLDADPDEVAEQLAADGLSDGLRGLEVTWTGMGETALALPASAAENLERMWTASLVRAGVPADRLVVDHTGTPPRRPRPGTVLPADPVTVPEVATVVVGAGTTITVPDALLFEPGSAALAPDADAVLRPVAEQLTDGSVRVTGHSADFGDTAYQRDISERRAEAVAARLAALGVHPARLHTAGAGSSEPAVPEWRDGVHDLAAAATNRRVVITVTP